jgi:ferrochelatase
VAFATAAYSSYSACRQYLEDIDRARALVGDHAPVIDKVRPFWNHEGFIGATVDRVDHALGRASAGAPAEVRLVFTAHSIPRSMARSCDYEAQLRDAAGLVVARLAESGVEPRWDLVFQSRSGPPEVPWLEPDIVDHLETIRAQGVTDVVVAPIGFLSDHMEVMFDLDVQASEAAERLGLRMERAETVGIHPDFVAGVADLIDELVIGTRPTALGPLGPRPRPCRANCCPPPRPRRPS